MMIKRIPFSITRLFFDSSKKEGSKKYLLSKNIMLKLSGCDCVHATYVALDVTDKHHHPSSAY